MTMCPYIGNPDYRFEKEWALFNRFYDPYNSTYEWNAYDVVNPDPNSKDYYVHRAWYKYRPTVGIETYYDNNEIVTESYGGEYLAS